VSLVFIFGENLCVANSDCRFDGSIGLLGLSACMWAFFAFDTVVSFMLDIASIFVIPVDTVHPGGILASVFPFLALR
jgi:hypothetical protein